MVLMVISYASLVVFAGAIVYRVVKISRLPIHLRWELYPVPHEKGRAGYGGSYLEELNWWTKPRPTSHIGELQVMVPEILLLAGVWKHNRSHWLRSFPFHFGLYLLGATLALLFVGGIATAAGVSVAPGGPLPGVILFQLTRICGFAGLAVGLLGSLALLARRILEPDYRDYTKKGDYFNLLCFIVVLAIALAAHLTGDSGFAVVRTHFARLVTFDPGFSPPRTSMVRGLYAPPAISPLSAIEIALAPLLLAYIPLTHMSHFFTKWFMYHDIRWGDEPNMRGGKIEAQVNQVLQYPVSWSASHIRGDGKKTWGDVAAASGAEEGSTKP
jgi:nitrate reductase gamma subunit